MGRQRPNEIAYLMSLLEVNIIVINETGFGIQMKIERPTAKDVFHNVLRGVFRLDRFIHAICLNVVCLNRPLRASVRSHFWRTQFLTIAWRAENGGKNGNIKRLQQENALKVVNMCFHHVSTIERSLFKGRYINRPPMDSASGRPPAFI